MTAPVHRLRNRLMLAFAVFALAVASLFGLYVAVFVYSVEDRFFEAMLEQEARQQLEQRATRGTWSPPRNAFMTMHDSPATFPADLKVAFNAEPWRREIAGTEGRHYHLRALQPGGSGAPGWLVAEVSQQLVVRPMRRQILALLAWSGVAVVVVAVLAGAWLARRTTRPLSKLAALVDDMAPARLPVGFAADFPDDEVGVLARGLDRLSGQVRAFVAREHAFTRDASHELRTPLAVIRSAIEQLAHEPGLSAAGRLQLDHVQQSARHLEQTVITLLTLAREENVERDATPLAVLPVLEQVVVEQAALLEGKPVAVRVDVPGDARLTVPGPVLHMLLANLVGNAFAHTRAGEVHIDVAAGRLRIRNTAPAGDPDTIVRPFAKGEGSAGFGLGLAIVHRLCDRFAIDLRIEGTEHATVASFSVQQGRAHGCPTQGVATGAGPLPSTAKVRDALPNGGGAHGKQGRGQYPR